MRSLRRGLVRVRRAIGNRWAVAICLGVVVGLVSAFALTRPRSDLDVFVDKCLRNGNSATHCTCSFNAYSEMQEPYASLVKSSVHDTSAGYRSQLTSVVVRKLTEHALGVDPADVERELRGVPRHKMLPKVLTSLAAWIAANRRRRPRERPVPSGGYRR